MGYVAEVQVKVNGAVPVPGDEVYTPGGKARVIEVCESPNNRGVVHFVRVGHGRSYNWEQYLAPEQDHLKRRFGEM